MKLISRTVFAIATSLALLGITAVSASAGVQRECETAANDRKISVAYREDGTHKQFMAVLALPKNSAAPGRSVTLQVLKNSSARPVSVATRALVKLKNGKLTAKVYFDSADKPGGVVKPFPSNFPALGLPAKAQFKLGTSTLASCEF